MSDLAGLFLNNLLPIFLMAGTGALLVRWLHVEPRGLSTVTFYIFSPCLIFNLIVHSQLDSGDVLRIMSLTVITVLLVGGLTWLAGQLLRLERRSLAALLLASMFMNAGNFGLSVNLFAFGESALAYASLFFVTDAMLNYTVGVVIASLGSAGIGQALRNLLKVPTVYALILAFIFQRFDLQLPLPFERTVNVLAGASIPAMLVLLGMQLHTVQWTGKAVPLVLSSLMRLVISPALALLLTGFLNLEGAARQAGVLQSAMPTAVLNTVIATEYNAEPSFVTAAVFLSTLLSAVTLTLLLSYLGG